MYILYIYIYYVVSPLRYLRFRGLRASARRSMRVNSWHFVQSLPARGTEAVVYFHHGDFPIKNGDLYGKHKNKLLKMARSK